MRLTRTLFTSAAVAALGLLPLLGRAQAVATYTIVGSGNATDPLAGVGATNATAGNLTRVGVTASSSGSNFRASNWATGGTTGTAVGAITGNIDLNKYIDFTLTPATGYLLNLTSISFGFGRSGTGPRRFEWRSSLNSYGAAINTAGSSVGTGGTLTSGVFAETVDAGSNISGNTLALGGVTYTGLSAAITFRLYGYSSEAAGGTGGLAGNLVINGSVTSTGTVAATQGAGSYPSGGTAYNFGNQTQGTTSGTVAFTLTNGVGTPVTISSITTSGDYATTGTVPTSIPASGTATVNVQFSPTAQGTRTGTLIINSNSNANGTYTVNLTGNGTAPLLNPEINVQQAAVDYLTGSTYTGFANTPQGSPSTATVFTIQNTSLVDALNISGIVASGDFSTTGTIPTTVAANSSATVSVVFTPTAQGVRTGTLTINSNDQDEGSYVINLSGQGIAPVPTLTAINPSTTIYGGATYTVSLTGTNFNQTLASNSISFNGNTYTPATVNGAGTLLTVALPVPATTTNYPITVTTPSGTTSSQTLIVTAPPAGFFEPFDAGFKSGYAIGNVTLATGSYAFDDALSGNTVSDPRNNLYSARIQTGSVTMNFDKANGAGTITVYAANFGSDNAGRLRVSVSNDGGTTFTAYISPNTTLTGTLAQYTFSANVAGNVRVRFSNPTGSSSARINIDDVQIGDFTGPPCTAPTAVSAGSVTQTTAQVSFTGNATAANGYIVTATPTVGSPVTATGANSPINLIGLTASTTYSLTVTSDCGGSSLATSNPAVSFSTLAPPPNIYLWTGPANGAYATAGNWTSQAGSAIGSGLPRTTPANNDQLVFNSAATVNVDFASPQTIGALSIAASAAVTLNVAVDKTLTIDNGVSGDDFTVGTGASLTLNSTASGAGLKINLTSGTTGTVNGTVTATGTTGTATDHQLTAVAVSSVPGLVFANGSQAILAATLSGNFFGSANASSVSFEAGSTLQQNTGANPFALTAPASVITLAPTSLFRYIGSGTPSVAGRTYGNVEFAPSSTTTTLTGATTWQMNDLTFTGALRNLNINVNASVVITGNLTVVGSAKLAFLPASSGALTFGATSTVTLGDSALTVQNRTISKTSGTLEISRLMIGNTGTTALTSPLRITESLRLNNGNLASDGNLTLVSTPARTAYIITTNAGTGTVTGNITAQRAVSASSPFQGKGYRHYSSPVSGATVAGLATGSFTPIVDPAYPNPVIPYDALTFPNVFAYDPTVVPAAATFASFSNGYVMPGTTLAVGQGYSVNKDASTVAFTGTATTGPQTLPLTGDGSSGIFNGWNLKGNPYASGLDWTKATFSGNVQTTISVWRPTSLNGGFYSPIANTGLNQTLALGQAFFIRKTDGAAASASFNNAARVPGATTLFQRSTAPDNGAGLALRIANTTAPDVTPTVLVRFQDGASTEYEPANDGLAPGRSTGEVPTLLTVLGSGEANVNTLPALQANATVLLPLVVATTVDGTYTISAGELTNLPANARIELLDAKLNRTHNLQSGAYTFASTADYAGQRFTLRVTTANGVLGLTNDLSASALTLYPNPATGLVRISAPANATVRVFDALGRTVRTLAVNQAGAELNVSLQGLTPGLYTVRAAGASQQLVVQ